MTLLRTFLVLVLAAVLVTTAASANVAIAADRTVLDGEFVADTLEAEDAYSVFRAAAIETIGEQAAGPAGGSVGADIRETAMKRAVTEEYVENQAEANIDRVYAYLHGERDTLEIVVETGPVIDRLGPAIADTIAERPVGELIEATGVEPEFDRAPVDASLLAKLESGPDGYAEARAEFRDAVEAQVLDAMVEEAVATLSNDELLALVIPDYDPSAYTAEEKERMVEDRRAEIEAALRERIRQEQGSEIDRRVNERLDRVASGVDAPEDPTTMEEAASALQAVLVRGLADRDLGYEPFHQDLAQAKRTVGTIAGETVQTQVRSGVGETVSLTEQLDAEFRDRLSTLRDAVRLVDLSTILLPLFGLVLVGLLWLVTRSGVVVSLTTGVSLLLVGGGSAAGARLAAAEIKSTFVPRGQTAPGDMVALANAFVERVLGTFFQQSLLLAGLGAVLVVGALLVSFEVIEWPREDEPTLKD